MPAKAGIQTGDGELKTQDWIPAWAGMTGDVECEVRR
jgi:hypothetical protein